MYECLVVTIEFYGRDLHEVLRSRWPWFWKTQGDKRKKEFYLFFRLKTIEYECDIWKKICPVVGEAMV